MKVEDKTIESLPEHSVNMRDGFMEVGRSNMRKLNGLLTMCAWCKKVRDDQGYWKRVGAYISELPYGTITHGICPDCAVKLTAEIEAC